MDGTQSLWASGRFDGSNGEGQILFGRMYEDPAIEDSVFPRGSRVFCIASAGDTAIALAADRRVTAVDINPVQLAYAERRIAGAAPELGSAERLMGFGRRLFALAGWRRSNVECFLALEDPAEQVDFWHRVLNTRRFRFGVDRLLSFGSLRRAYAPEFFSSLPAELGRVMRARLERGWSRHPNRNNVWARALLLGETRESPRLVRTDQIRLACADAASYLDSCPAESFDGFTLSNILDVAGDDYRLRLISALKRAAAPNATVVLRSFAEPSDRGRASEWAARDRSMLWGVVDVRPVASISDRSWGRHVS